MLTCEECRMIGVTPYAVYGGRVHSFKVREKQAFDGERDRVIPHGTGDYAEAVARVDARRAAP